MRKLKYEVVLSSQRSVLGGWVSPECRHSQGFRKDIHLGAGLASASRLGGSGPEGHLNGDPPETAG